jgi:hypothetical protein
MNRWASVQRQKASPTADLTKSPGGMFHHEGPIRWGALTRAATAAIRTKKIERLMTPATLSRGEMLEGVTFASGAHQNCAHAGEHASAHSLGPFSVSPLKVSERVIEAYMNLTTKSDSGKEHGRVSASVRIDPLLTVA